MALTTALWGRSLDLLLVFGAVIAGCGGGGGGNGTSGAATPLSQPTPVATVAIERAAGVATSTVTALALLVSGTPGATTGRGAAAATPELQAIPLGLALQLVTDTPLRTVSRFAPATRGTCPSGVGTVDASCEPHNGNYTLSGTYSGCGTYSSTLGSVTLDGSLSVTAADSIVCSGQFPSTGTSTVKMTNYKLKAVQGNNQVNMSASATITYALTGGGCAGGSGTVTIDGSLSQTSTADGLDMALVARTLTASLASSGAPCVERMTVRGGLDVTDHAFARQFSATLSNLRLTLTPEASGSVLATIDGGLTSSCIGAATLSTSDAIALAGGDACPWAGAFTVTRDDGAKGGITFHKDGSLTVSYGGAQADKVAASCQAASLSQCQ